MGQVDDRASADAGEPNLAGPLDTVEISAEAQRQLPGELDEAQRVQVQQLKSRDREVRAHEQAHMSAAGPYARGGAQYAYQTGPDGQRYAIGGEVSIDTSPIGGNPEATMTKARVIRAAAMAPANPSAQDRQVAAAATRMESQARQELQTTKQRESEESEDDQESDETVGTRFDVVV